MGKELVLPEIYNEFHSRCKVSKPKAMVGTDLRSDSDELNIWAIELLQESGITNFLEEQDYVFMMHQGYMFWYFKADGNQNPDVYFYFEGRNLPNKEFPLKEFLDYYPTRLCDFSNKQDEWKKQIEFYNDLIQNYHWKQKPMLTLIDQLKETGFWHKYFPSNSHEALGLSKVMDDVKFDNRMVFINYKSENDIFEIHYQKVPGETIKTTIVNRVIITNEFNKIDYWLNNDTKHNNVE